MSTGLENRYVAVPDIWVGGNLFLCYEKGNPAACVAPDVLLAKGVAKWMRPNYLLWDEVPPSLVVEVTSRKTRREDQDKKPIYERIGVEEYVQFDPHGDYLRPRLQGCRLEGGRYQSLRLEEDGSLLSRTTGLRFKPEGKRLRLVDAVTGQPLLWSEEVEAARVVAEKRAAEEAAARQEAEAARRAEAAARRAAEAAQRTESAARQAAEERVRALEEELSRLRKGQNG